MGVLFPIAEKITTKTGAISISTDALIEEVIDNPLKKAVILKATPKNAAMISLQ
jgi:hypothetical protein